MQIYGWRCERVTSLPGFAWLKNSVRDGSRNFPRRLTYDPPCNAILTRAVRLRARTSGRSVFERRAVWAGLPVDHTTPDGSLGGVSVPAVCGRDHLRWCGPATTRGSGRHPVGRATRGASPEEASPPSYLCGLAVRMPRDTQSGGKWSYLHCARRTCRERGRHPLPYPPERLFWSEH